MNDSRFAGAVVLSSCVLAAACREGGTSPKGGPELSATVAVAPSDPRANGSILGTVLGTRVPNGSATIDPVPGVRVTIYRRRSEAVLAAVVTDSSGTFQFTRVPAGEYELVATPRDDSPYRGFGRWRASVSGTGEVSITVPLDRKPWEGVTGGCAPLVTTVATTPTDAVPAAVQPAVYRSSPPRAVITFACA